MLKIQFTKGAMGSGIIVPLRPLSNKLEVLEGIEDAVVVDGGGDEVS